MVFADTRQKDFQSRITWRPETTTSKSMSVDDFKSYVQTSWKSPTQAWTELESMWYRIEWIDEAEKRFNHSILDTQKNSFKWLRNMATWEEALRERWAKKLQQAVHYSNPMNVVSQFLWAWVAKVPEFVGNTLWSLRDITWDFYAEQEAWPAFPKKAFMRFPWATEDMYEEHVAQAKQYDQERILRRQETTEDIKEFGGLMKKTTQDVLWVNPTLPEAKAWEFVSSIWMSIYWWPKATAKSSTIRWIWQRIGIWWIEWARYSAWEEWEIQRQEVALGMLLEPIWAFAVDKVLWKLAKEAPEQVAKRVDTEMKLWTKTKSEAVRELTEASAPKVSVTERMVWIRPDIKRRISGKRDMLQDYFNVSHARNVDDTMPTPLAYASEKVVEARDKLVYQLDGTGSEIGKFRNKVKNVSVGIDNMNNIQKSFTDSIEWLNLTIKDWQVVRMPWKVKGKVSDTEVRTLQDIFDDIMVVKNSWKIEDIIDLRIAVDDKVKFAKTAREAWSNIDAVSRNVRKAAADANLSVIGKEQWQLYAEYSQMMDLLNDLNKYVNSRTWPEFLLKRVLSERDRVPAEMMRTLQKYTWIDLMDHAVMSQIATDIVGNWAQKWLFRQEIAKAWLDAQDIISQISPRAGFLYNTMKKAWKAMLDEESIFLRAADEEVIEEWLQKMWMNFWWVLDDMPTKWSDDVGWAWVANVSDDLLQEARKYDSSDEFVEWVMKRKTYWYWHSPNINWVPSFDLTKKVDWEQMIPKDMYEKWYWSRWTPEDLESIWALKKVKWNPDAEVTIYRAMPVNERNIGDWVTFSKKYAQGHAKSNPWMNVYSKKVKAKDVRWAMDDINEFWYFPKDELSQLRQIREQANNSLQ